MVVAVPDEQATVWIGRMGNDVATRIDDTTANWLRVALITTFPNIVMRAREEDPDLATDEQARYGNTAAKLGYLWRIAEFEYINQPEAPNDALRAYLLENHTEAVFGADWFPNVCGTAAALRAMSIDAPDAQETAVLLDPVGLGSDMHAKMCEDSVGRLVMDDDDRERDLDGAGVTVGDLVVSWGFGYYLRVCEKSLPGEAIAALAEM